MKHEFFQIHFSNSVAEICLNDCTFCTPHKLNLTNRKCAKTRHFVKTCCPEIYVKLVKTGISPPAKTSAKYSLIFKVCLDSRQILQKIRATFGICTLSKIIFLKYCTVRTERSQLQCRQEYSLTSKSCTIFEFLLELHFFNSARRKEPCFFPKL